MRQRWGGVDPPCYGEAVRGLVRGILATAALLAVGSCLGGCGGGQVEPKVGPCVTLKSDANNPTGTPPQITGVIDCSDPHEQGKVVNASSDGTCPPPAALFGIINNAGN